MEDEIKLKNKKWTSYNLDYAKDHEKEDPENYWEFKEIFNLYKPCPKDKILEIGCNTGEFCWLLKEKYNTTPLGVDINSHAISIAREKYPDIKFQVKDLFELEGNYDVIYMQHVIEHLEEPKRALIKLKKHLTDKGKLIITCPNKWAYLLKLICWIQKTKFCYDPTHLIEFNPVSLSKIIKDSEYKPLKIVTKPLGVPYISRISPKLYYSIPSYLFGAYIFALVQK